MLVGVYSPLPRWTLPKKSGRLGGAGDGITEQLAFAGPALLSQTRSCPEASGTFRRQTWTGAMMLGSWALQAPQVQGIVLEVGGAASWMETDGVLPVPPGQPDTVGGIAGRGVGLRDRLSSLHRQ